jgi:regulator of nucleoside diphosphate kinase
MTRQNTNGPGNARPAPRPRIVITASDHARLMKLTETVLSRTASSPVAEYLSDELSRAHIVPDADCADDVARMGSHVTYSDGATGRTRTVTFVYPEAADIDRNQISVLTPIGAALIGLSPNQSIDWPTPGGGSSTLTVIEVRNDEAVS